MLITQDQIAGNELSRTGDLAPANVRLAQRGVRIERRDRAARRARRRGRSRGPVLRRAAHDRLCGARRLRLPPAHRRAGRRRRCSPATASRHARCTRRSSTAAGPRSRSTTPPPGAPSSRRRPSPPEPRRETSRRRCRHCDGRRDVTRPDRLARRKVDGPGGEAKRQRCRCASAVRVRNGSSCVRSRGMRINSEESAPREAAISLVHTSSTSTHGPCSDRLEQVAQACLSIAHPSDAESRATTRGPAVGAIRTVAGDGPAAQARRPSPSAPTLPRTDADRCAWRESAAARLVGSADMSDDGAAARAGAPGSRAVGHGRHAGRHRAVLDRLRVRARAPSSAGTWTDDHAHAHRRPRPARRGGVHPRARRRRPADRRHRQPPARRRDPACAATRCRGGPGLASCCASCAATTFRVRW